MENIGTSTPQHILALKVAHHLALGGHQEKAAFWLNHMCQTANPPLVKLLLEHWEKQAKDAPQLLDVPKPECDRVLYEHPDQTTPSPPSTAPAPMSHSG